MHSGERRRRVRALAVAIVLLIALGAGRLFMWPPTDAPGRADAIVVLGGRGRRTETGLWLARDGRAPTLAISVPEVLLGECTESQVPAGVELRCFHPVPFTTQGEARYIAGLAAERGWRRIIVVAGDQQVVRARLRVDRCFSGRIMMVGVRPPWSSVPYVLAYESAALVKALVLQRTC